MVMAGRHIRHDWQQFVPWEQKSVRTLCGKTSTWNATGIPGVTEQPEVVEVGNKKVFGWCSACSVSAYQTAEHVTTGRVIVDENIFELYDRVARITGPIYDKYLARQEAARQKYRRLV